MWCVAVGFHSNQIMQFIMVGSYFVTQYYQILQKKPDVVHQFYSDGSSMIRVDGDSMESAAGILVLHLVLRGCTAVEVYFDYLRSFTVEFDEFFEEGIISEIEVGLGPCGELQYPSYPEQHGWKNPGIGEFQRKIKDIGLGGGWCCHSS